MLTVDYDRFAIEPGMSVLDVGCGQGRHSYEALSRGGDVTAFDLNEDDLAEVATMFGAMDAEGEVPMDVDLSYVEDRQVVLHGTGLLEVALQSGEHASVLSLTLLVGGYAQAWALGLRAKANMTETVRAWREYAPDLLVLPHPSWRNTAWLKKNPWFEAEVLPYLRERVQRILTSANPAAVRSSEKDSPVVS